MSDLGGQVGIICERIRPDERMIIDAAKKKNIDLTVHDAETIHFEITGKDEKDFESAILQRSISYFRGIHITAILENIGVTVLNSYQAASICGNKILTSLTLSKEKIPTPRTIIAFTKEAALDAIEKIGYPAVLKPIIGSWGRLIAPLKDIDSARAILENREYMYPLYQIYYIQEMVLRPQRDIRCFVIGDQAVAAIYRYSAPGDWKTNIARGGHAEPCKITSEIEDLSLKAAASVGGGAFGVDMMESERGLTVHEINNTTEFNMTVRTTGVDIPRLLLEFLLDLARR